MHSELYCHFRTFILHQPHIVLLGDAHAFGSVDWKETQHLTDLLKKISEKEEACVFLVEDYFKATQKELKSVTPDYCKKSLLWGLIQRINVMRPDISTVCIERSTIVGRALNFPRCYDSFPLFWDYSPKKLIQEGVISERLETNGYNLSFLDLINEVRMLQRVLENRRSSISFGQDIQDFISSRQSEIDRQLENLFQILLGYNIKETEGMLETAIRYWILEKINKHKTRVPEIVQVSHELEAFISDYKRGLSKEEWTRRTEMLIERCSEISRVTWQPIKEEPSLSVKLAATLNALPLIRNWFKQVPVGEQKPVQPGQVVTLPEIPFDSPRQHLCGCIGQLRLLVIDSHATLDIIEHKDKHVVLIAGDDHIQNISHYLVDLGSLQMEKKVRDVKLNQMLLDLKKLPI
jgi:hypothetical protein